MQDVRKFLNNLPYTRKPYLDEDVVTDVDFTTLRTYERNAIHTLPYISIDRFLQDGFFADAFAEFHTMDDNGRRIYGPQFWITEHEGTWYIINNEGYDYARYVVKLLCYKPETKSYQYSVYGY